MLQMHQTLCFRMKIRDEQLSINSSQLSCKRIFNASFVPIFAAVTAQKRERNLWFIIAIIKIKGERSAHAHLLNDFFAALSLSERDDEELTWRVGRDEMRSSSSSSPLLLEELIIYTKAAPRGPLHASPIFIHTDERSLLFGVRNLREEFSTRSQQSDSQTGLNFSVVGGADVS
jgi:hypothetical protein